MRTEEVYTLERCVPFKIISNQKDIPLKGIRTQEALVKYILVRWYGIETIKSTNECSAKAKSGSQILVLKEPTRLTRCDTGCFVSELSHQSSSIAQLASGRQVFFQRILYSSVIMTEPRGLPTIIISLLSSSYLLAHLLTGCIDFWFQSLFPATVKGP